RHAFINSPSDNVHSGYLTPERQERPGLAQLPSAQIRFRATFTQPGVFKYICTLHDELGMVGQVMVLPSEGMRICVSPCRTISGLRPVITRSDIAAPGISGVALNPSAPFTGLLGQVMVLPSLTISEKRFARYLPETLPAESRGTARILSLPGSCRLRLGS